MSDLEHAKRIMRECESAWARGRVEGLQEAANYLRTEVGCQCNSGALSADEWFMHHTYCPINQAMAMDDLAQKAYEQLKRIRDANKPA